MVELGITRILADLGDDSDEVAEHDLEGLRKATSSSEDDPHNALPKRELLESSNSECNAHFIILSF